MKYSYRRLTINKKIESLKQEVSVFHVPRDFCCSFLVPRVFVSGHAVAKVNTKFGCSENAEYGV